MVTPKDIFDKLDNHELSGFLQSKYFLKGTLLQKKGDAAAKIFYVKKGILRSYTVDEKGKEHTFMFAPEEWIVSDLNSIAYNQPPELFIDVLEDCDVAIITKEYFSNMIVSHHSNSVTLSELLLKRTATLQKRVLMLMSDSALERYQYFVEMYQNIIQRIPQKMIASYLGITPEALSKIKSNKLKQHKIANLKT